ncbi:MAG: TRAP transporter large permease [Lawsonibacter sp.]
MIYMPCIVAFVLLFTGVPVGLALLSSAMLYFGFLTDTLPMTGVIQKMVASTMSTSLLTIPLFLMVGTVMNYVGITARLMRWCNTLVGHKDGGLAQVNVLLSTVNGGICGSSGADAAMQSKMLVPEMVKAGYPLAFSAAVTAASGLIAPMIPPGNALILYATMTDTSVVRMFMAGYLPGLLMCAAELIVVKIICSRNRWQTRSKRASAKEILTTTLDALWSILVMVVLIAGLRLGLFTVTEGAVVIICMCLLIGIFIYRTITPSQIPHMFVETFHLTGNIMVMLMGSLLFGYYLTWARIPQGIAGAMLSVTSNKFVFILLAMILMLVMGMFMDGTAMLMIVTPILYPVAVSYDINVIQFGILMLINGYVGSLTPPVGGVMYTVCNLTKVSIPDFFREVRPFIAALIVVMVLVALFPPISTLLPDLTYGG